MERIEWTADNAPSSADCDLYIRFVSETTSEQRASIRTELEWRRAAEMTAQGLVRWRDAWVTPERAAELREAHVAALRRQYESMRAMRSNPFLDRLWSEF